jgi:uncharacterized heparinase superfamily protein
MSSLLYYLRRTREQSLRETLNLGGRLLADKASAIVQPGYDRLFARTPSEEDILKRSGEKNWRELADVLKRRERPCLFEWPLLQERKTILARADEMLNEPLRWHTDSRSGYTWDVNLHYRRIPLSPQPGVDIKNPWDLSRFHHAVVLAHAYQITSNDKYATELVRRITDWIQCNPYRYGVNWTSAMEAGIRAMNWLCAFYLARSASAFDERFLAEFLTSLYGHAQFIKSNLEYREAWIDGKRRRLNSNHYLCDIAGLLFISILLPELRLNEERRFATAELEHELFEQTYLDGADYEHSTYYHRFVTEVFGVAFALIKSNGNEIRPAIEARLTAMKLFLANCTHADGTLPQIGDNDGGTLFPFPLLHTDASTQSAGFHDAGVYSMRGNESHVVVSAARVGMRGFGSHSHNDVLSFEYWWRGLAWIVDPGTYVYLPDRQARNWFRSTEAHNTVRVDRTEINPFHEESIFQMIDVAKVDVELWEPGEQHDILAARHTGYSRLPGQVIHRRQFEFDKHCARLVITDLVEGSGTHLLESFFQINPAVDVQQQGTDYLLAVGEKQLSVRITGDGIECEIETGAYSRTYGIREPATRIIARGLVPLPATIRTVLQPC